MKTFGLALFIAGVLLIAGFCYADHSMPLHYVQRQDDPTSPMVYFNKNFELGYTLYRSIGSLTTVDIYLYLYDLNSDTHYQGKLYFKIKTPTGEIQKITRNYTDERFLYILQLQLLPDQTYHLNVSIEGDKSLSFDVPFEVPPSPQTMAANSNSHLLSTIGIVGAISILPLTLFIAALVSRRRLILPKNLP
ncbi:MAG: hypothetical protein HYV97_07970 [Bdellovibrio sp.]|nr:hypothetical protein [Bdellovibrio sp.]